MKLIDYFDRGAELYPDRYCLHEGTRCSAKLGAVKAPKSVDFVAVLPRSPVGKVLKKTLRGPYWPGRARKI